MGTPLPPVQLEPAPFGLVNSKTVVDEKLRWESGFEQETIACNADVNIIDACNPGLSASVVTATGVSSLGKYIPFTVQAKVECSVLGGMRIDWEERARMALDACQSKAVETEFWDGLFASQVDDPDNYQNRYLNDGNATDVTPTPGTAVKVRHGLALLEGALADAGCGNRGFIHAPTSIASVLPVKRDGDVLETVIGNYVISGTGYSGTGTGVTEPVTGTKMWMYATGPVMVRLGDVYVVPGNVPQSINTNVNTIAITAERAASVVWDGCAHFGVLVDLSLDYA